MSVETINKIKEAFNEQPSYIRNELVEKINVPRTTVYDNLIRLQNQGFVRKYSKKRNNLKGRPNEIWEKI